MEGTAEEPEEGVISSVQLLAARRDRLAHEKLRIGALCSSLLESPERKVNDNSFLALTQFLSLDFQAP